MNENKLEIKNLYVSSEEKEIVKGVSLEIKSGEIHLILGKNGSGKSTFAQGVIGFSPYKVQGSIKLNGEEISKLKIHEKARKGIYIAFQNPVEIPGIKNHTLVRQSLRALGKEKELNDFKNKFNEKLSSVNLSEEFYERDVNFNFSGGEKKKNEIAQMLILKPSFSILDEIDSGLDVDSIKSISKIIEDSAKEGMGVILITHNPLMIKQINYTHLYLMENGGIVSKDKELLNHFEEKGFSILE
jgi:Fe-S cluster assembly ATP-binding protein